MVVSIYSQKNSKRLQYILKLIFEDLMGCKFDLTTNLSEFNEKKGVKISYSNLVGRNDDTFYICPKNILFESDIRHQDIQYVEYRNITCPFSTYIDNCLFPFDFFAASFYLISRYEEYLPHKKDEHKRFRAEESMAFQKNFLHLPVINIWVMDLITKIQTKFPNFKTQELSYSYFPTYDIDIAWSYKNKGITRNLGGFIRDLLLFNTINLQKRFAVIFKNKKDPYDTYELQKQYQKDYQLKPIYFILFSELGPFDKNISIKNAEFQNLIKDLRDHAEIGIHPSYQSNENTKILKKEIDDLSETVHVDIIRSRQHFLKLNLPGTYRNLINLGITEDFTMGYASQVGFRASIASSFNFYDLDLETETKLRIHPFAIMDGTLKDYLKVDKEEAKQIISKIVLEVKKAKGVFISLWHNESLSNQERWKGWLEVYEHLLKEASQ